MRLLVFDGVQEGTRLARCEHRRFALVHDVFRAADGIGFTSRTWPVTRQSNSIRTAARAA
jgi:hypothetical protein